MKRAIIALALVWVSVFAQACGASTLSKLHDRLNQTAKALNAAAKTNHSFYETGVYGTVGSTQAIDWRQKGATAVHDANEKLILALNTAKQLTAATFEQGKLAVLQALAQATASLTTGNANFDLVLQGIATLINQAVILIEAFRSAHLPVVLPEIRTWQLQEVNVWAS